MTTDIQYHSEALGGESSQPAINVKDDVLYAREEPYATLIEQVGENVANALYERAREGFWMDADVLADDFGYGEAFSEGRSGGWLVVSTPPDLDAEDETCDRCGFHLTTRTCGNRSTCDDCGDEQRWLGDERRELWLTFAAAVESAIKDARAYYVELMREHLAACTFEASESAAMAERDIVTVDA
jgi:hypothetical protein